MPDDDVATPREISDPRRIRALAHPLRVELMDVLGDEPAGLTATECATRIGESVASCSFHLHTLARYGYVEAGERRGREKPWRLVSAWHDFQSALADPSGAAALEEVISYQTDYQFARLRESIQLLSTDEPEWRDAATLTSLTFWATADELAKIQRDVIAVWSRYAARTTHPSRRPEGSRPISFFAAALVDYRREERDARGAEPT
jgi:DNA-binding transcriptional ArsR family regulator